MARKICIVLLCVALALAACGQVSPSRDEPTPDIDQYAELPTQEDETQEAASYILALPVDAPDLHTPTPADITNLRAEQLIVPIGSDVFNSGSRVVQVGDSFYFFAPCDEPESPDYAQAIFVRREGNAERYRLLETHGSSALHYIDGYMVASPFLDGRRRIIRINTQTGEVDTSFPLGEIIYMDFERQEIIFSYWPADSQNAPGLHRIGFDGAGEQLIVRGRYTFLGIANDIIYLQRWHYEERWRDEGSFDTVLYTVNRDGSGFSRLVSIPLPPLPDWIDEPSHWHLETVQQLSVYEGWIILTIGVHQGTGRYFYGNFVRMRTDGGEMERLFLADSERFFLMDGWIYYNVSSFGGLGSGAFRIPADFSTESEFLGTNFILQTVGGRIFYAGGRGIGGRELRSHNPDGSDSVLLFSGSDVPRFEHSNFLSIFDIRIDGRYVFFTIRISGHATGDTWRGHSCYIAHYRVRYDGSGLTLINEENLCWVGID